MGESLILGLVLSLGGIGASANIDLIDTYRNLEPTEEVTLEWARFNFDYEMDLINNYSEFYQWKDDIGNCEGPLDDGSYGPILQMDYALSNGGTFGVIATNDQTCLNRGIGSYPFAQEIEDWRMIAYTKIIDGYTVYFSSSVVNPGVPVLRAEIIDFDRGPFTYIEFIYSSDVFVTMAMDSSMFTMKGMHMFECSRNVPKILEGFCRKNGAIPLESELREAAEHFDEIVSSFRVLE